MTPASDPVVDQFRSPARFGEFGGTWFMHRFPGIRSDSDLYTFGYRFKPWTSAPIATRDEILTPPLSSCRVARWTASLRRRMYRR